MLLPESTTTLPDGCPNAVRHLHDQDHWIAIPRIVFRAYSPGYQEWFGVYALGTFEISAALVFRITMHQDYDPECSGFEMYFNGLLVAVSKPTPVLGLHLVYL